VPREHEAFDEKHSPFIAAQPSCDCVGAHVQRSVVGDSVVGDIDGSGDGAADGAPLDGAALGAAVVGTALGV
jgi:hypothetical protein